MSVKVMSLVWYSDIEKPSSKFTLLALADRADDNGFCWPGIENLMVKTSQSRASVFRALKELEAAGWIKRANRYRDGHRITNIYRIDLIKLRQHQHAADSGSENDLNKYFTEPDAEGQTIDPGSSKSDESAGQDLGLNLRRSEPSSSTQTSQSETSYVSNRDFIGLKLRPNTSVDTSVDTSVKTFKQKPSVSSKKTEPATSGTDCKRKQAASQRKTVADPKPRGTRIPADFQPDATMVAWARENTPNVDGRYETEKFIDYWTAKTGAGATKLDWRSTWRNWMRQAQERLSLRGSRTSVPAGNHQAFQNPDMSRYYESF